MFEICKREVRKQKVSRKFWKENVVVAVGWEVKIDKVSRYVPITLGSF